MNTLNSCINCSYSHEVQVTPTKDKVFNKSYGEYVKYVEQLAIKYVKDNRCFDGNSVLSPIHTHTEIREIAKLREIGAKTRILPYQDSILVNSTPLSQNISNLLGDKDTLKNYSYVNKLISTLSQKGIYIINFTNFVVTLNPQDDFCKQRELLFEIADVVGELCTRGIADRYMDTENSSMFYLSPINIIFSVENLGYDITENEYKSLYSMRNRINNELIVLTAMDLGFDVKFLFSDNGVNIDTFECDNDNPIIVESDNTEDNLFY